MKNWTATLSVILSVLVLTCSCQHIKDSKETKVENSGRKQVTKESWDITFEDSLGHQQKLKTGEVDKKDVGTKLSKVAVDGNCFAEGNHFYYMIGLEVFRDKGEKLRELAWGREYYVEYCGKYKEKLYLVVCRGDELYNASKPTRFIMVDLNSWETKTINCSKLYGGFPDIFVYNEKIYIQDNSFPEKFDEIDGNGKKIRTISLGNKEDKGDNIRLQGIMDGKIYYLTWNDNQYVLKSKDMKTGEENRVLQYEQPAYNKKKLEYSSSYFHMSGNNLFIMDEFYVNNENTKYWYEEDPEPKYTLYHLSIKEGGKMKRVFKQKIVDCDFLDDDIYYIDEKHLLHRKNLKKSTDKIISKRKLEKVKCTKEGLFVNRYKEGEAYDEDVVEGDVIFYLDFDGKHEKKLVDNL